MNGVGRGLSWMVASSAVAAVILIGGAARAGVRVWTNGFEGREADAWWTAGNAGVDVGKGLAHRGSNNGWVRSTTGWNAVNTWVSTNPGEECHVTAWIRSSASINGYGYVSIRSEKEGSRVLNEEKILGVDIPIPLESGYRYYSFDFTADGSRVLFYAGLWGNGQDAWLQIDDVVVGCATPF